MKREERWYSSPQMIEPGEGTLKRPGNAVYLAIEAGHIHVARYVFEQSAEVDIGHVKVATDHRNVEALELLLQHEWNINTPWMWCVPPLLT